MNARDVSDTVTVVLTIRMAILPSACVTKVICNYEIVTSQVVMVQSNSNSIDVVIVFTKPLHAKKDF